mmetsp:Transcript_8714/g.24342  ORF Transcript_8714/g.24342 Transcript_8714/m.24342 type:complete len:209 (-) Transcript_8714:563-1189(-)
MTPELLHFWIVQGSVHNVALHGVRKHQPKDEHHEREQADSPSEWKYGAGHRQDHDSKFPKEAEHAQYSNRPSKPEGAEHASVAQACARRLDDHVQHRHEDQTHIQQVPIPIFTRPKFGPPSQHAKSEFNRKCNGEDQFNQEPRRNVNLITSPSGEVFDGDGQRVMPRVGDEHGITTDGRRKPKLCPHRVHNGTELRRVSGVHGALVVK